MGIRQSGCAPLEIGGANVSACLCALVFATGSSTIKPKTIFASNIAGPCSTKRRSVPCKIVPRPPFPSIYQLSVWPCIDRRRLRGQVAQYVYGLQRYSRLTPSKQYYLRCSASVAFAGGTFANPNIRQRREAVKTNHILKPKLHMHVHHT